MNYTPQEIAEAERIVNDIAEHIDNRESRAALRQALSIYADKLDESRPARSSDESALMLLQLRVLELKAKYDTDIAELNQRLQDRTSGMLDSLAAARLASSAASFRAGWEQGIASFFNPEQPDIEEALREHLEP